MGDDGFIKPMFGAGKGSTQAAAKPKGKCKAKAKPKSNAKAKGKTLAKKPVDTDEEALEGDAAASPEDDDDNADADVADEPKKPEAKNAVIFKTAAGHRVCTVVVCRADCKSDKAQVMSVSDAAAGETAHSAKEICNLVAEQFNKMDNDAPDGKIAGNKELLAYIRGEVRKMRKAILKQEPEYLWI